MTETRSDSARAVDGNAKPGITEWRRRQWVVDAPYQLRGGVLVGTVAIVLLALLNASLLVQNRAAAAAMTAQTPFAAHDRTSWAWLLVASAVFLLGVVFIGLLESHRTAGAAFAIRRAVEALREGRPDVRIRLRRRDHLQELAASINKLAETIDLERRGRG